MTTLHGAAQKAIYWLDQNGGAHIADELREALAQQGEPVAWVDMVDGAPTEQPRLWQEHSHDEVALYTAPQPATQAERVSLTDEQIDEVWVEHGLDECDPHGFARAIEAAHGITENKP